MNQWSVYVLQTLEFQVMFNLLVRMIQERILWTANEDAQLVKSALAFLFLQREHRAFND